MKEGSVQLCAFGLVVDYQDRQVNFFVLRQTNDRRLRGRCCSRYIAKVLQKAENNVNAYIAATAPLACCFYIPANIRHARHVYM